MRIFWHPTGPLMRWEDNALLIEDLNPHIRTTWRLTRMERFKIGLRFMRAAICRTTKPVAGMAQLSGGRMTGDANLLRRH